MAIPELDEAGHLPPGIHDGSLDEVEQRFGRFQRTDQRRKLFDKLVQLIRHARLSGVVVHVILDGSFVTDQDAPNDIDLICVVRSSLDLRQTLRPIEYNLLSKSWIRREFSFDALIAREGSDALETYVEFFSQVRKRPEMRKGLVRIAL